MSEVGRIAMAEKAQRRWHKRFGYYWLRILSRLTAVTFFLMRCRGRERIPAHGGTLVCSNHQSFFDPVLVGLGFNRQLNYLARETLFRFAPFRWLIEFLDAIPIDREGLGLAGLKETLRRLKRGEMVLIFPEGTRTRDGDVQDFKPGFVALARRSKAWLLPVGLDGAYAAWPRNAAFPRLSRIHVCIGEPIAPEQAASLSDDELIGELARRIRECHRQARQGRLR
jgi:1-acyl-sn-glycerol-3-phosphate acyltransferase